MMVEINMAYSVLKSF